MSYSLRQYPASSKNYDVGRGGKAINSIVIHHAATTSFDGIGATFANPNRGASAHYGVGQNNNVDQYVQEKDTAWHCGNYPRNQTSIGIENVNSTGAPTWDIANETFNTLCELVGDIASRNGLLPLVVGKNLFGHKDVSLKPTACPLHLEPRLQEIADRVNGGTPVPPTPTPPANNADQIVTIGSNIVFNPTYRVDDLQKIGGIWQVRTNVLCPEGFTWNDNGIPVMPLVEVAPNTDQRLAVGSQYKLPGRYTVLNLGKYKTHWMAQIKSGAYKFWVDIATATEV